MTAGLDPVWNTSCRPNMPFSIQMQGKRFPKVSAEMNDLLFSTTKQPPPLSGFSVTGGAWCLGQKKNTHNQKNPKTNSICSDTYADMQVCKYGKGLEHAIKDLQML